MRIQGAWSTGVSFLRADGSLIGTVGGRGAESRDAPSVAEPTASHDAPSVAEPVASRDAPSVAEPAASRDAPSVAEPAASRDSAGQAKPSAAEAYPDPQQEKALALKALQKLEVPARQAKSLLHAAVTEQPALRRAAAEDLVRAVLLRG